MSNHDTIAPNSGFDTHPHRNIEIVTWVLQGALVHQDSQGHAGIIYPNLAQRMTAGSGKRHSERNDRPAIEHGSAQPVELTQMWVAPDEAEVAPGYQQLELDPADLQGQLVVVASGMPRDRNDAAVHIRNRFVAFHVARLEPGQAVQLPDAPYTHVYVPRGRTTLEAADKLDAGDAARLTAAGRRRLEAVETSEVLVWEMHAALQSRGS